MVRRVVVGMACVLVGGLLLCAPAGAIYPPVPPVKPAKPVVVTPKVQPTVIVVRVPVQRRRALVRTGSSSAVPLAALAAGSVGFGTVLVFLGRRRRLSEGQPS